MDNDINQSDDKELSPVADSMAAFSESLKSLSESLDLLYIRNNASARHKFCEEWPDVSRYLFGEELITYDIEGVMLEKRKHRAELEEQADFRRIDLKKTLREIVKKSVDSGALQSEYVSSVIDKYGAALARRLYAEDIIERVRPGALALLNDNGETDEQGEDAISETSLPQQSVEEVVKEAAKEEKVQHDVPQIQDEDEGDKILVLEEKALYDNLSQVLKGDKEL